MIKIKGFTLIELLAVILILGIVALIAIPLIANIVKESKKSAFETTANNIIETVEKTCQEQQLKSEELVKTYTFISGVVSPNLNISGSLPTSGMATVNNNCDVSVSLTNGKYVITKTYSKDTLTVAQGNKYNLYTNGTAFYFNPVTGEKYDSSQAVSTTGTKTGCMKWFAFNDSDTSYTVNLILDHNTTATTSWYTNNQSQFGPNRALEKLKDDTSSWLGVSTRTDSYNLNNGTANYTINYSTYKARLITANEVARITGNVSFNELNQATAIFYLDNNLATAPNPYLGTYKWLYNYTKSCTAYGCSIADATTYGYWTSTAGLGVSDYVWFVSRFGSLDFNIHANNSYHGIRPVITVLKSVIE